MLLRLWYSREAALSQRYAAHWYLVRLIEGWKALHGPLGKLISLFSIIVSSPNLMHTIIWLNAVDLAEAGIRSNVWQLLVACAVLQKMWHLGIGIWSILIPILVAQHLLPISEVLHRRPMPFTIDLIASWDFTHGSREVQNGQRLMIAQDLAIGRMIAHISHHRWMPTSNFIVFLLRS